MDSNIGSVLDSTFHFQTGNWSDLFTPLSFMFTSIDSEGTERILKSYSNSSTLDTSFFHPGNFTIVMTVMNSVGVEAKKNLYISLFNISLPNELALLRSYQNTVRYFTILFC